jgi:hypothetical protein
MAKKKHTPMEDEKRSVGRPSSYDPEVHPEQARRLCLLGATDAEMAEFFGVSEVTVNAWKGKHPEFLKSIKEGKEIADMAVAESLYGRALGSRYTEQMAFKIKVGKDLERVEIVDVERAVPPDPTSMIFWLKNRRSRHWRDKVTTEHTGPNGVPLSIFTGFADSNGGAKR